MKAVYVTEDAEVTDSMLDKGALLELSLDGLMAVKLENSTGVTAFTVLPDEKMCLSVSVDELDINSVEKGLKAVLLLQVEIC